MKFRIFVGGVLLILGLCTFVGHSTGSGSTPSTITADKTMSAESGEVDFVGTWPGIWGPYRNARAEGQLELPPNSTLKEVWRRPLGGGYSEVAMEAGRGYTMFTDGDQDHLLAFGVATGVKIWQVPLGETHRGRGGSHDGPLSTPVFHRGRIHALNPFGKLFTFDAQTGETLWQRDLVDEFAAEMPGFGFGTTPLPLGETLIVQSGGERHTVVALESATGNLLWASQPATGVGYASPTLMTLGGQRQIVGAATDKIFGLHPENGAVLWTHEAFGEARQTPVVLSGNRIFVNFWDESAVLEIRSPSGGAPSGGAPSGDSPSGESTHEWSVKEVWRKPVFKANYSPAVFRDGHIYGMNRSYLHCLDAATGEVVWRHKVYESTLILVDEYLAVLGEKSGKLQLIKATPQGFEETFQVSVFTSGARSITGPMFVDGHFLLRNLEEMVLLQPATATTTAESSAMVVQPEVTNTAQSVAVNPTAQSTGVWPHWGGPKNNGHSAATGVFDRPFSFRELWRFPVNFGISSLAIHSGRMFSIETTEEGDDLFALDAASGSLLWRQQLGKGPAGQDEFGAVTTPATDGETVFLLSSVCNLEARAASDGALLWSYDIRETFNTGALRNGCWTSPLLDGDRVILQVNGEPDKRVMAFDKKTGAVGWTAQGVARAVRSTATIGQLAGRRQIVVHDIQRTRQGGVYGLDSRDGSLLWNFRFEPTESFSYDTPILLAGDRVAQLTWNEMYTVQVSRRGEAFEARLDWSGNAIKAGALPVNRHAVAHGDYLYGFSQDFLRCLEVATGRVMWKQKIYQGSLMLVDNHLVVLSQGAGRLRVVEASPDGYREKAQVQILAAGAATDTPPSFADGRIYVRNSEEVVALEVVLAGDAHRNGNRPPIHE